MPTFRGLVLLSALLCSGSCSHKPWWELTSPKSHTWVIIQAFSSDSLLGPKDPQDLWSMPNQIQANLAGWSCASASLQKSQS